MRVFADANILFSASVKESATRSLLNAANKYGRVITSPHAWEEAERNLSRKRPQHLKDFKELKKVINISNTFYKPMEIDLPQQDIPIIAGAAGAQCTYLWTSDKRHFSPFYGKSIHKVTVISSIMLADLLIKKGWKP